MVKYSIESSYALDSITHEEEFSDGLKLILLFNFQ